MLDSDDIELEEATNVVVYEEIEFRFDGGELVPMFISVSGPGELRWRCVYVCLFEVSVAAGSMRRLNVGCSVDELSAGRVAEIGRG